VELRHHAEILRLLQIEPRPSAQARATLERREAACGVRFPEAVREWFSLEGAGEIFSSNTNQDCLTPVEELGKPAEVAQGYLHVATENQAVVAWYVKLGGAEDGPVMHNNDEWNEDLSKTPWQAAATSFRTFLFDELGGHRWESWYTGLYLRAEARGPTPDLLERLRARMNEGPREASVHRFFTPSSLLHASGVGDDRAVWTFKAKSADALFELVESVWDFGDLAEKLRPEGCDADVRVHGEAVLHRLRR
jgi:hypothetical protein